MDSFPLGTPGETPEVLTKRWKTMTTSARTARDIMTGDATCASASETLVDAARKMRDLDVGALPICGEDNRLKASSPTATSW